MLAEYGYHPDGTYKKTIFDDVSRIDLGKKIFYGRDTFKIIEDTTFL